MRRKLKRFFKSQLNKRGYDFVKLQGAHDGYRSYKRPECAESGKIFGIGYNKTGTTSLNRMMEGFGFRVAPQGQQERLFTLNVLSGNYSGLKEFIEDYDFFQDLPFSQGLSFVACDVMFPNSKFILTIRDEDDWYQSILNFHKRIFNFSSKDELSEDFFLGKNLYLAENYVYETKKAMITVVDELSPREDWQLLYDEDHYKRIYRSRNEEIIKYFKNREEDFLAIDISKEDDNGKLVDFLNLPESYVSKFPHENKTSDKRFKS